MMKTRSVSIVKDEITVPTPIEFHKVDSLPDKTAMNDDLIGHCYYCDGKISIWTEEGWSEFGGNDNGVYVAEYGEDLSTVLGKILDFTNGDKPTQFYIAYNVAMLPANVDGAGYIVSAYIQEDTPVEIRCECTGSGWTKRSAITDGAITSDKIAKGAKNPWVIKYSSSFISMSQDIYDAIKNAGEVLPDVIITYNTNHQLYRVTKYPSGNLQYLDFGGSSNTYVRATFTGDGELTYKCEVIVSPANYLRNINGSVASNNLVTGAHNPYIVKVTNSDIATASLDLTASNATFTMDDDCYNAINNTASYDVLPDVILPYGARANNRIFRFERYDDDSLKTVDFGDPDNYSRITFTQGTKTYKVDGLGRLSGNYIQSSNTSTTQKFTGTLDATSGTINVKTPTADAEAATKKYVDDKVNGLPNGMTYETIVPGEHTEGFETNIEIVPFTDDNEHIIIIDCEDYTPVSVTSTGIKWLNGNALDITKMSNFTTYMVSVYKNLASWGEFS